MAEIKVPDSDHLMRYVPYGQQLRAPETDAFLGILGIAFSVRPSDQGGLSVTWIEHYGEKDVATVTVAAAAFRDSLEKKKLAPKAYFAVGNAGLTRRLAAEHGKKIRLISAPDGSNTGHVEIHRFSDDDRTLLDALALDVYTEHIAVASLEFES
ncbi:MULTISPECIES: hypothetical protein [unclassified Sphingopyxis]|uniref:hypothetical protein n=1 Tax=unclassified Sphingopyxis TaxID=2614943 RepID=UPI0024ADE90E|nr:MULTISPECIES: hypothetical protein [unclassified Sphingopyxis]